MARLADDLRAEFPSMRGFSRANLFYMRRFAQAWSDEAAIVQQPVALEVIDSELAQQITKDPFALDFLAIGADTTERDLEERLTARIVDTLRELGAGFRAERSAASPATTAATMGRVEEAGVAYLVFDDSR